MNKHNVKACLHAYFSKMYSEWQSTSTMTVQLAFYTRGLHPHKYQARGLQQSTCKTRTSLNLITFHKPVPLESLNDPFHEDREAMRLRREVGKGEGCETDAEVRRRGSQSVFDGPVGAVCCLKEEHVSGLILPPVLALKHLCRLAARQC